MACKHCGGKTNLNKLLCDLCSKKALQVLPADPKERVQIYKLLMESGNPTTRYAAKQLISEDVEALEEQMYDPTDRMYNPREA